MATCKTCGKRTVRVDTALGLPVHLDAGMSDAGNVVIEGDNEHPVARVVEAGKGSFTLHACAPQPETHWSDK